MKKIAEVKKAQKKFLQAAADLKGHEMVEDDVVYYRVGDESRDGESTLFLSNFMPHRGSDRVEKFSKKEIKEMLNRGREMEE